LGIKKIADQRGGARICIVVGVLPALAFDHALDVVADETVAVETDEVLRNERPGVLRALR